MFDLALTNDRGKKQDLTLGGGARGKKNQKNRAANKSKKERENQIFARTQGIGHLPIGEREGKIILPKRRNRREREGTEIYESRKIPPGGIAPRMRLRKTEMKRREKKGDLGDVAARVHLSAARSGRTNGPKKTVEERTERDQAIAGAQQKYGRESVARGESPGGEEVRGVLRMNNPTAGIRAGGHRERARKTQG